MIWFFKKVLPGMLILDYKQMPSGNGYTLSGPWQGTLVDPTPIGFKADAEMLAKRSDVVETDNKGEPYVRPTGPHWVPSGNLQAVNTDGILTASVSSIGQIDPPKVEAAVDDPEVVAKDPVQVLTTEKSVEVAAEEAITDEAIETPVEEEKAPDEPAKRRRGRPKKKRD